ncbi:MAG: hypothetical protein RMK00_04280 [Bacteroidota bacterium]|nr:hypothetical protein [Bacteroidota bacterium]
MKLCLVILAALTILLPAQDAGWEIHPWMRFEWERLRYSNPQTGSIPPQAALRDAEYAARIASLQQEKSASTASSQVQPIGPTNVAGRTRALVIDRRAPNVLVCGGVTGGIWRSIDYGQSWVRLTPPTLVPHVSCIVQSIQDPNTWYAGTGEGLSTTERRTSTLLRTIGTGTGIYRSTDNGLSWSLISPFPTAQPNSTPAQSWQITWRLDLLPTPQGELLFAACYSGIYSWNGSTWKMEIGDSTSPPFCTDLVTAAGKVYVALGATDEGIRPTNYGIFERLPNGSWRNITPAGFPTVRRMILAAAADGSILYVLTQAPRAWSQRYMSFASTHTLWRYSAATHQWENCTEWIDALLRRTEYSLETLGGYCMALAVHPRQPNVVFVGGTDLFSSHDGCQSLAFHLGGYPYIVEAGALHPDVHALVFDPTDYNRLYVATDGGVYLTTSPLQQGETYWTALNNGLTTTQVYHVALDKLSSDSRLVIAGFQDNSNWYTPAATYGVPWIFAGGGDGCRVLVGDGRRLLFATSQFGYVYAVDATEEEPLFRPLPSLPKSSKMFVTEIAYDRATNTLVVAVDNSLYRLRVDTQTQDSSWLHAASLPTSSLISTIALRGSRALAGTVDGLLYRADISTGIVEQITAPLPAGGFIAAIDWDEEDTNRIIVTISNYTLPSIFATWDNGRNWIAVGGTLDEEMYGWGPSVRVVRSLHRNGKRLYIAGTSVGAFTADSLSPTTQWQPLGLTSLGALPVEAIDLRSSDGLVILGTHGGGVFACTLNPSAAATDTVDSSGTFFVEQCIPHPVKDYAIINAHVPSSGGTITLHLYDLQGRLLLHRTQEVLRPGVFSFVLSPSEFARQPNGAYIYSVQWNKHRATGAFIHIGQ